MINFVLKIIKPIYNAFHLVDWEKNQRMDQLI